MNELEKRPSAPPRRPTLGEAVDTAFGDYQLAVGKVAQPRDHVAVALARKYALIEVASVGVHNVSLTLQRLFELDSVFRQRTASTF
jgi:hypothetical protein